MLFPLQYEEIVVNALREDLGRAGDLTSNLTVPATARCQANLVARQAGTVAGIEVAARVFQLLDPSIQVERLVEEGSRVEAGTVLLKVTGSARTILAGERTALNFLGRMSGISQATATGVARLKGTRSKLVATRKTTPGLRMRENWAVLSGGGESHRFGLDDGILIKDNHVALAGGVVEALRRVQQGAPHLIKIELEVDTLQQLEEILSVLEQHSLRLDAMLLDNFSPVQLREAVARVAGRFVLEASGGLTLDRLGEVAQTGVDLISLGSLTHSVKNFDVALDVVESRILAGCPQ
ncbi:carboxylating nicotinate-nucleotide diphosphorylase [bacterium]|nr:carboxylating nicotinate-nucleotide diphosphorylase [bacterium]